MSSRPSLLTHLCLGVAALLSAGQAGANLIDATYGAGVGSFEQGSFVPRGTGSWNFQSLGAGDTSITGWTVGGVGVDWLSEPFYNASQGVHAVDLGWYTGGAGSVAISLPTVAGMGYTLTFDAAAVPGYASYTNQGWVSAGSLGAAFAPAFSAAHDFTGQVYHAQAFQFTALGASTLLTFSATTAGTSYGPVIDNVSVAALPVPEAQSWALMLAGLAALGGLARRRLQR